jgi:hypothetical protein
MTQIFDGASSPQIFDIPVPRQCPFVLVVFPTWRFWHGFKDNFAWLDRSLAGSGVKDLFFLSVLPWDQSSSRPNTSLKI